MPCDENRNINSRFCSINVKKDTKSCNRYFPVTRMCYVTMLEVLCILQQQQQQLQTKKQKHSIPVLWGWVSNFLLPIQFLPYQDRSTTSRTDRPTYRPVLFLIVPKAEYETSSNKGGGIDALIYHYGLPRKVKCLASNQAFIWVLQDGLVPD